jgi:hypothetical protein
MVKIIIAFQQLVKGKASKRLTEKQVVDTVSDDLQRGFLSGRETF